jgi:PAS domain S-box-containing protein
VQDLEILKRRLERERRARLEAEAILEAKSRELFEANKKLQELNLSLEQEVVERTRELSESQKQFKLLVESAGDIILNADLSGVLTYVNPAAIRLLGYSEKELLKKQYFELIRDTDRQRVRDFYTEMIEKKETRSYLEFPVVLKDGRARWLGQLLQISYVKGKPERITAVARDIQELRDARKALENSEKKYRGIIEGMQLGLMEVNEKGLAAFVNHWFCEMTGYEATEIIGKDPDDLFLTEEGRNLMQQQNSSRLKGRSGVYEIQLRRKSGDMIWVAISGAPIYNREGEIIGTVGMHLDITPQKQLQARLQNAIRDAEKARMAEKAFLAHMSHEIRTPLNALMGMANLLSSTVLSEQQQEYVNDMMHASDVLHGLISDVLDISKIEAGEVEVNKTPVDLHKTLGMIIKTMEYRARDRGNSLKLIKDQKLPATVMADRIILNQVLLNLLDNANKFTSDGSVSLSVTSESAQGDEPFLIHFEVKDTGIGIDPERLTRVFDRFQQVKDTRASSEQQGTGLGLSISRSLAELHGGGISAYSKPGAGSTFSFSLLVDPVAKADGLPQPGDEESARSLKDISVLVAEDSYLTRKYLQGLFIQWKLNYELVEDGQEALEASQRARYDLILMDMQMPRMDGYQAAENIRADKSNPNCDIPILALTASALIDEREKALEAGMNDHLTKPFTPFQLRDFMERNLKFSFAERKNPGEKFSFKSMDVPSFMDTEYLDEMYDGDLEHARHMFTLFTGMINEEMALGQSHLKKNDRTSTVKWLHKIAPTFSMVGLSHAQSKLVDREHALKEGVAWELEKEEIVRLLDQLKEEMVELKRFKLRLDKI